MLVRTLCKWGNSARDRFLIHSQNLRNSSFGSALTKEPKNHLIDSSFSLAKVKGMGLRRVSFIAFLTVKSLNFFAI
jgi:hypothetical protein|tara:strand:- start:419 stop:646 length:228 start_codon:yes stop_codon:yes gene_type:complete